MKVSELWLREWVNPQLTSQELASQLTMAGLEVDALSPVAGDFTKVVVASVLATKPHPQADKLTLCDVDAGSGARYQIVCGAQNVRQGLKVALALTGANLPGGMVIKETKLRGELSQGMLCSNAELGLEERSDGIMELPEDAPIGTNLRDYLQLDDTILDVDLTPNRADCFSMVGVAREVAALNKLVFQPLEIPDAVTHQGEPLPIHVEASSACPTYCGRVIRGIDAEANTPVWLKERLRRAGIRPILPVVDVTNYVMLELGQPMHAFDYQAISGGIVVRFAKDEEKITLLDGQSIHLTPDVLVIADNNQLLAMAGVMGGESSAVHAKTRDIFLESAFFRPKAISGVARRYGLCTDSSLRFERGVDPTRQSRALERATDLLLSIVGGEPGVVHSCVDTSEQPVVAPILFNPDQVKLISGMAIPHEEIASILERLGMTVSKQDTLWEVIPPAFRFDVALSVDLVEEVVRIYGYDKLTKEPIATDMTAGSIDPTSRLELELASFFKSRGYFETISYSFVDPQLQDVIYPETPTLTLLNPISQELSQMRIGLWPGLLASMIHNIHRQSMAIKLFELGVIFDVQEKTHEEHACVAGLITGDHAGMSWCEKPARQFDFYDVKGDLHALFKTLGITSADFVAANHPALHPGQTARVLVDGQEAGWVGLLHPRLEDALDLEQPVILFELRLASLIAKGRSIFQAISKFPSIRRDLSFIIDKGVSAARIEEVVRGAVAPDLLKGFHVFDVYMGKGIPEGKKSVAIAMILQDQTRTLVDAEINSLIGAIINKLTDELAILLRE